MKSQLIPHEIPDQPFVKLGMDFLGPLPATDLDNMHILIFTDYATRYVEAFATRDQKTETVARILVDHIIFRHGAPRELLSDQGRKFLAHLIKEICATFGTRKIQTTAYHPASNGLTERFNKTICNTLASYVESHQRDWDVYLAGAVFAYNTSKQESSKFSPFELITGRQPRLPNDLDLITPKTLFVQNLTAMWREAKENIEKHAIKSKMLHDSNHRHIAFKIGDRVRINIPTTMTGTKRKLQRNIWSEPVKIISVNNTNNIEVETKNGMSKWVNIDRVKKAEIERNIKNNSTTSNQHPYITRSGRHSKPVKRYGTF